MINKITAEGRFLIRSATLADVPQMREVQLRCFPTLAKHELLTEAHYANHIKVFPEGQLVVMDDNRVVASSSTLRMQFPKPEHTFLEATDNLWITNAHLPQGDWLYQFDMGVLPAYRGLKLSKDIYLAQQELAKDLAMKGQITVGMTIGYVNYKEKYTIQEYCEKLKNYELEDPTVTPQRKAGFHWVNPIFNYVDDPSAGNCSILLVMPLNDSETIKEIN